MTAKSTITMLLAILAGLLLLAIAGFTFYAFSEGEGSGSEEKVGSVAQVSNLAGGAA
ncbi:MULTISPECIES: hypothetical protein [unclassified Streptomyces]|uniref:hypothetical protein n=1 Tax=unclassified Streptomyces TaxID=2593676 RepID=UPI0033FFCF8F